MPIRAQILNEQRTGWHGQGRAETEQSVGRSVLFSNANSSDPHLGEPNREFVSRSSG
jgi:hypothetical protein